jgi:TonB family protein
MPKLTALVVGCALLGVGLSSSVALAETQTDAVTDLQNRYHHALQEIERLQRELDAAKQEMERLQQHRGHAELSTPHDWFTTGNTALAQKKYQEAIAAFTRAIETRPQDAKAHRNRGVASASLGEYQQAIQDYTTAMALDPQDALAYNQRGIAYYQQDKTPQAIDDFTRAIEKNPQLAEAYSNRGIAYRQLGNYPQAMQDLRSAAQLGLELAPPSLQVLREEVRQAQERLHQAGFQPGPADGLPGPQTTAALRAYQRSRSLSVTGGLDAATKHALGLQPVSPPPPPGAETPPRFVHQPKPEYPLLARQQGWEGTVTLRLELLADGKVGEVEIAKSSGYPLLDTAAQESAKTWAHEPATHQGVPVPRWVTLSVHFALDKGTATNR